MPREKIRSPHETLHRAMPEVDIAWGADSMDVEIGVINTAVDAAERLDELLLGVELSDAQRLEIIGRLTQVHAPGRGWYTHLGRGEVNRMIRILRKARDQAMGADA
jgi:hypothetical protein